ncbi:MAG TPA: HAMP domain-containing sensor histidine kinase [Candidatus Eisenbacteria bacterium]|nr:HAMP domain-containing sensor histidine kinase [Candidatus Eisenbacteria bacterium]
MILRRVLIGGLFFVALSATASTLLVHKSFKRSPASTEIVKRQLSPRFEGNRRSQGLEEKITYWAKVLTSNRDVLVYGGLAFFAVVMMGLVIGAAVSDPKPKDESFVEVLKRQKEQAEKLARMKSEFLNQVSHELRTPLAVIIGYVECLTDGLYGQIDAKHQEILTVVGKQSNHLREMIDQILIFSRLEANRQPLRIQDSCVNTVVNDLRETFDFLCRQKGLALHWEIPSEPIMIRTDTDRLKEILSNLLQNALKYTDRGSITMRLQALRTKDVILEVTDTGIGIPEKFLKTIFDPFVQVHKTSTENARGGIGLGLSIVKKHVEQIRGTITVESEVGKGSTFRIILPRLYEQRESKRRQLLGLIKLPYRTRLDPSLHSSGVDKASEPTRAVG